MSKLVNVRLQRYILELMANIQFLFIFLHILYESQPSRLKNFKLSLKRISVIKICRNLHQI